MRNRYYILIIAVLGGALSTSAQNIKLISATQRSWSGGIAGHHGENYTFIVEFTDIKKDVVPDTIWIGNDPVPILITEGNYAQNVNTKATKTKKGIRFEINAGTAHDDYADRYAPYGKEPRKEPPPPIKYSGVALLSYQYKGNQKYFTISKITNSLPPVNYP